MATSTLLIVSGVVCLYADWMIAGCPLWCDWHFRGLAFLGGILVFCGGVNLPLALSDWQKREMR